MNQIETEEILVVMRDVLGKEFYSKMHINIENGNLVRLPIENTIPKGVYIITLTSKSQIHSQRIIVK